MNHGILLLLLLLQLRLQPFYWLCFSACLHIKLENFVNSDLSFAMSVSLCKSFIVSNFDTIKILTVCSHHVTYTFQSESTLYSCLNVKELLAQSKHEIRSLSDCSWTRTHLVHERTLNHLAKLFSFFKIFVNFNS